MRFFCAEVLPRLRAAAPLPFRVTIVGGSPSAQVQVLSSRSR